MYTVDQNEQFIIFLTSLGVGFILGILYDILRALRLSFTKGKAATVVFDLLYFFLFALLSFIYMLASNKGEVRSYIIIGEIVGAVFYYFSFGIVVMKITDRVAALLKRFYRLVFKVTSAPFRALKRLFLFIFDKSSRFFEKKRKKNEKIRKKLLPKLRLYVYNLLDILDVGKTHTKKGGSDFGKEEKEKTK